MGDSEKSEFETRGDAGFVEDVGQVALHGFFAEGELLGDVAIAAAFNDASDDVEFARGEAVGFALRGLCLTHEVMQSGDEIDDALAADPIVAGIHGANGGVEASCQSVFEDDAAGADVERFNDLLGGDGGREQNDFDGRRAIHDGAHGLETGQARHLDIEQEDVGGLLQGLGDGLIAIVGFSNDFKAVALGEHVAHTDTDYRMIIGEYDANGLLFHRSPIPPKSRD
jgi:hypothetical protein